MTYRKTYLEDVLGGGAPLKKCPKGKAGKDCRKEKLKDAGRKAAVAVGGATLIHLGMGGYKKGDGDWVKKEGSLKKICPPGKKGKACRDAKKKKKHSSDDFTDDTPHKARVWDYQLEENYIPTKPLKKICPLGTKGAECRAKKKSKSHAWSFKSKKGSRHLGGKF